MEMRSRENIRRSYSLHVCLLKEKRKIEYARENTVEKCKLILHATNDFSSIFARIFRSRKEHLYIDKYHQRHIMRLTSTAFTISDTIKYKMKRSNNF